MENKKQIKLYLGDNIESLKKLPDNSIDSVVSDVPYGLGKEQDMNVVLKDWLDKGYSEIKGSGFMGKVWDSYVPQPIFWKEVYRVLKPGGHVLSFFGTRTYDIGTMAIRLAGFEIRDQIMWIYGSGFPKSHNIGKSYDKKVGIDIPKNKMRIVNSVGIDNYNGDGTGRRYDSVNYKSKNEWEGWGTALKPANEPICVARKPLSEKTIVDNVIRWGVGGININGCRIGTDTIQQRQYDRTPEHGGQYGNHSERISNGIITETEGRFPANIIFDEEAAAMLDEQSGFSKTTADKNYKYSNTDCSDSSNTFTGRGKYTPREDKGGASRFFYVPKVGKRERNMGLDGFEDKIIEGRDEGQDELNVAYKKRPTPQKNTHPTLKPINLMNYLCRLVTPPGGIVLDPFMGSGSTGISACLEGFRFVGMELDEDYFKIAEARIGAFEEYRPLLKQ